MRRIQFIIRISMDRMIFIASTSVSTCRPNGCVFFFSFALGKGMFSALANWCVRHYPYDIEALTRQSAENECERGREKNSIGFCFSCCFQNLITSTNSWSLLEIIEVAHPRHQRPKKNECSPNPKCIRLRYTRRMYGPRPLQRTRTSSKASGAHLVNNNNIFF